MFRGLRTVKLLANNGKLSFKKFVIIRAATFSTYKPLPIRYSNTLLLQQEAPILSKQIVGQASLSSKLNSVKPAAPSSSKAPTVSELKILKDLLKYIWPKGDNKVKIRVGMALLLLIGAKLLNVQVPFFFKQAIDSMNVDWADNTVALPAAIGLTILSYGAARFGSVLFGELRNAVFARVAQNAIRTISLQTFNHLMKLDLGWHLSRQTGGLTRAMDRGTKGISYVLGAMIFHIIPITFEISVVCGILTYQFGASFAGITFTTMLLYAIFTFRTTAWRNQFRRDANKADNKGASVALDSLINFEAVKYFNNEHIWPRNTIVH